MTKKSSKTSKTKWKVKTMNEDEGYYSNMTLSEAREALERNLERGTHCPCCQQYARNYKRKLNSGMARSLIHIYNWYTQQKTRKPFLHVKDYLRENALHNSHDWTLLKYWDLLELKKEEREDGSSRNGYYRITQKGILFVEGKIKVWDHIYIYNNEVQGFSQDTLTIKQALGNKFDYAELMGYKTFAGDTIIDAWLRSGMQFTQVEDGWYECSSDSGEKYRCHPYTAKCTCPAHKYGTKIMCKHLEELYRRLKTMQGIDNLDESKIQRSEPQKKECTHRDEYGNLTYEKEDDRCDTDRGTYGSVWYACTQCDEDITELVDDEKEVKNNEDRD